MKIPIPLRTHVRTIDDDGDAVEFDDHLYNVVIEVDSNGTPYATQRRGISNSPHANDWDASAAGAGDIGRGVYHYDSNYFMVNGNTVYRNEYSGTSWSLGAAANPQLGRVFFAESDQYMVLIDPINNDGFSYDPGTNTFTTIAALPALINGGIVYLNGRIYVSGNGGRIYNSDLNDATAGYTDFVTAERSTDNIVAIDLHHDHIVAFGGNSIEFFYDGATSLGSPLLRRQDIAYELGLISADAFARYKDIIVFCGTDDTGSIKLYKLENFQIAPISDIMVDKWMRDDYRTILPQIRISAFGYDGRGMFCFWVAGLTGPGGFSPTLVIDGDYLYEWDLDGVSEISNFPIIDFFQVEPGTTTIGTPFGQLGNGDLFEFNLVGAGFIPFVDDLGSTTVAATPIIQWSSFTGGTKKWKFCKSAELDGDYSAGVTGTLQWTDENGAYNTGHTLSLAARSRIVSMGRFSERDFKFTQNPSGTVDMRLRGLELDIELGSY